MANAGTIDESVDHNNTGSSNGSIALVAAFTAAVTTLVTGLPMEFISEAIVFPWAHETAFGSTVMQATGEHLVPIFNTIGLFFGIEPYGGALTDIPVVNF